MPVEFLGIATTSDASEAAARTTAPFDTDYLERLVRAHEDNGWTRVLFAYGSSGPEPAALAAYVAARTESIELLLAHRPNVSYPTYAAKSFATLDQLSHGRFSVHFITGGSDHEQQREGDTLTKDERYARTREYIRVVKKAWASREPFDHDGEFYTFRDFALDVTPFDGRTPTISFGGSSDAAYRVGAAEADIFAVWGEPLDRTAEQIARIHRESAAAGRATPPRIHAAFRPIIAPTEEQAWEKAEQILGRIEARLDSGGLPGRRTPGAAPENAGSQRLLEIAAQGDRFDTALWTATARVTGGAGNSNALVGTPETVAQALLAYYDLGVRVISARGYDLLDDAADFGAHVIPLVREGVAARDAAAAAATPDPRTSDDGAAGDADGEPAGRTDGSDDGVLASATR
ncbi:LLM class flavin-dependent oxidoreductase [Cellulomonas cellasea]|uniref:Alkanesulfonate monooxygenase n=2 Tax=Cellulomonas cellasea TaxID=43670 RepID=A0A0A0BBR0_9CELL|nr:LLM class flavin-dependent oxidoreductase [Cellulomonas cellasea]KGM03578.1 alkanesulfonate monooxygenase [Cellulomonas cellasea DSM 20118]GEA89225.1 alkanesulfonate monooxygenase [Cellulomonas cellasea]